MAAGVVGTANITFLTSLVSKKYTAVQYALLTSFMMLPGKLFSGFSGMLANFFKYEFGEENGWMAFFIFTSFLTLPSLLLLFITLNVIISMIKIYRLVFLFFISIISYASITPLKVVHRHLT